MATSWVIVRKSDGCPILETFSRQMCNLINTEKYEVVPVGEYLGKLNRTTRQIDAAQGA